MSQIIPIYIPTLISDVNYNPAKVYPRLFFYNGVVECEPYWVQYKSASGSAVIDNLELTSFPYVDHYNVVSGSFPSDGSKSLLFQNENPVYGAIPTGSLYSEYWETYINLLYDPKTRLINCSGIIPIADYFKMELNDIVEWRGNYYHLRAINDYNLTTGDCQIQLLGPIIKDTLSENYDCSFGFSVSSPVTTTTTTEGPVTTTTTLTPPTTTTTTTVAPVVCIIYRATNVTSNYSPGVTYTDCDGVERQTAAIPAGTNLTFCARQGQYIDPPYITITESGLGYCNPTTTTQAPTTTTTAAYSTFYINNSTGYANASAACGGSTAVRAIYTTPNYQTIGSISAYNTRFYTDSALTTVFNGDGLYYPITKTPAGPKNNWVSIVGAGYVGSIGNC